MANLAKYVVRLEAETAKYRQEMEKANKLLKSTAATQRSTLRKMDAAWASAGRAIKSGFLSVLAAAGVGISVAFTKKVTDAAANLDDFAIRLGVSAKELQTWQLAAATAGLNTNQFNLSLQRVSRRAAEAANGMGEAKEALKTLGIDAAAFNNLSLENRILDLARAFETAGSDSQKLALGFKLFDSEGTAFLQLLKSGEDGLIKLKQELSGQVWSDDQRLKLKEANKQLTLLAAKFTLLQGDVSAFLLGAGNDFIDWLDEIQSTDRYNKISTFFKNIGRAFSGQATLAAPPLLAGRQGVELTDATAARVRSNRPTSLGGGGGSGFGPGIDFGLGEGTTTRADAAGVTEALFGGFDRAKEEAKKTFKDISGDAQNQMTTFTEVWVANWAEGIKRAESQAQAFGNLFVDNLVQAQEEGFDGLLKGWARTLVQMAAKAQAMNLFKFLFPSGIGGGQGGAVGLVGKLFGFDSGGVVPGPKGAPQMALVHGGETILPTHKRGMGGMVINQNLTVNGASRSEFAAAAAALKEQTKAEVMDMIRRGR